MSEPIALYLRVSTADQDLAGQERELREYAISRGWNVGRVYAEKVTGTGRILREAYEQLLRDACEPLERGGTWANPSVAVISVGGRRWTRVLVWALDRWSRDPSFVQAIGSIERLEAVGVRWHSLKEPQLDSSEDGSPNLGRDLLRGILPVIAAFEARRRSERTQVAMREIRS